MAYTIYRLKKKNQMNYDKLKIHEKNISWEFNQFIVLGQLNL